MDKFKLENLGSGITAVISKEHGFGTDALLLADFAAVKESNRCCDMGSGCGIIPLLWLKKNMSRPVAAIEISEQGCEQMNKAARLLLEAKDFKAFCKSNHDAKTTFCDVSVARWVQSDSTHWYFEISADRFLRNMVRAVVGTLIEVGRGRMSMEKLRKVLAEGTRCDAGESMPAHGLFLWEVEY